MSVMSLPILFYDDRSPPARAVLMLIKRLKVKVDYRFLNIFEGEQNKPEFKELNPTHAVPALKHDELMLTDSHAILIHLCEKYEDPKELWPQEYNPRMLVLNKLLFNCYYFFSRDCEMMSGICNKGIANMDMGYHETRIMQAYQTMEEILKKSRFMAGEKMSLADYAIVATLSTVDMVFPLSERAEKYPKLWDWFRIMQELPEYSVNREGLLKFRKTLHETDKMHFPEKELQ